MRKQIAVPLWWLAVLLVVGGVVVNLLGLFNFSLSVWIGAALMVLGLNVLVGGDLVVAAPDKPFSARAQVSRAVLDVSSGLSNLQLRGSKKFDRLASVRAGAGANSNLDVADGVALLKVGHGLGWLSGVGNWRAMIATNVLWDVTARSTLGSFDVDLRDVRVEKVSIKCNLGDVRVTCPRRGRPMLELETSVGDVEVLLPRGTAARVHLKTGRLASVSLDDAWFEQQGPATFVTRDVEEAATVAEIGLRVWAGEARVRQA